MGGIAGQEGAAAAVLGDLAFVDAERRQPVGVLDDDISRTPLRQNRLDLLQGRVGAVAAVLGHTEVGDDAPPSLGDREEGQDAVLVPEDVQAILRIEAGEVAIGQQPVAGLRGSVEGEAQPMPHGRMGAVAADQPVRRERFGLAAGLAQHGLNLRALIDETVQRDIALDRDAALAEVLFQNTLVNGASSLAPHPTQGPFSGITVR